MYSVDKAQEPVAHPYSQTVDLLSIKKAQFLASLEGHFGSLNNESVNFLQGKVKAYNESHEFIIKTTAHYLRLVEYQFSRVFNLENDNRLYFIKSGVGRAVVQADCMCIVYLCVPVCVIEVGGASSILALKRHHPGFLHKV